MKKETLNFSSKTENLVMVEKFIDDICAEFKLNDDYYGNILVSITEAVNNAIKHGNKLDPAKTVNIDFIAKEGPELYFKITDQGDGFDFENIPDPTDPENIEKLNGRGVFLMKNLADQVTFADKGRIAELLFKIV